VVKDSVVLSPARSIESQLDEQTRLDQTPLVAYAIPDEKEDLGIAGLKARKKIAQGKASRRATPWVNVHKIPKPCKISLFPHFVVNFVEAN
jgi:hypothetical protein